MRRLLRTLGTLPLVLSQADLADTIRLDELPCGHLPAGRLFSAPLSPGYQAGRKETRRGSRRD